MIKLLDWTPKLTDEAKDIQYMYYQLNFVLINPYKIDTYEIYFCKDEYIYVKFMTSANVLTVFTSMPDSGTMFPWLSWVRPKKGQLSTAETSKFRPRRFWCRNCMEVGKSGEFSENPLEFSGLLVMSDPVVLCGNGSFQTPTLSNLSKSKRSQKK